MPPDPRQAQLYRTSATDAAYGANNINAVPQGAGYPPQGVPTLFITRADLERHYGASIQGFNVNDPAQAQRMQNAFVAVMEESGVPNSVLGGQTPAQFATTAVRSNLANEAAGDYAVADHPSRFGIGNQLGVIVLPAKPTSIATMFANYAGIPAAQAPNLSTLGAVNDRYFTLVHEGRHMAQNPTMTLPQKERDADAYAAAAHPGLAGALMDARMMGAVHLALQGVRVDHFAPFTEGIRAQYGENSPQANVSEQVANTVFQVLAGAALTEYQRTHPGASSADLMNAGPQVIGQMLHNAVTQHPEQFTRFGPAAPMLLASANMYLQAAHNHYPEVPAPGTAPVVATADKVIPSEEGRRPSSEGIVQGLQAGLTQTEPTMAQAQPAAVAFAAAPPTLAAAEPAAAPSPPQITIISKPNIDTPEVPPQRHTINLTSLAAAGQLAPPLPEPAPAALQVAAAPAVQPKEEFAPGEIKARPVVRMQLGT